MPYRNSKIIHIIKPLSRLLAKAYARNLYCDVTKPWHTGSVNGGGCGSGHCNMSIH